MRHRTQSSLSSPRHTAHPTAACLQSRLLAVALFPLLVGCGPSLPTLDTLARSGQVDARAPVQAHAVIDIAAPKQIVWQLLIHASDWPRWNQDIDEVSARGPLSQGDSFLWHTGVSTIHSQVQLWQPQSRLAWTGTAYTAKAVHVWNLHADDATHTRVEVDESMDGPLISAMLSSRQLTAMCQDWLAALKKAAERQ